MEIEFTNGCIWREVFKYVLEFRLKEVSVTVVLRFICECFFFFGFVLERDVKGDLTRELKKVNGVVDGVRGGDVVLLGR